MESVPTGQFNPIGSLEAMILLLKVKDFAWPTLLSKVTKIAKKSSDRQARRRMADLWKIFSNGNIQSSELCE